MNSGIIDSIWKLNLFIIMNQLNDYGKNSEYDITSK